MDFQELLLSKGYAPYRYNYTQREIVQVPIDKHLSHFSILSGSNFSYFDVRYIKQNKIIYYGLEDCKPDGSNFPKVHFPQIIWPKPFGPYVEDMDRAVNILTSKELLQILETHQNAHSKFSLKDWQIKSMASWWYKILHKFFHFTF